MKSPFSAFTVDLVFTNFALLTPMVKVLFCYCYIEQRGPFCSCCFARYMCLRVCYTYVEHAIDSGGEILKSLILFSLMHELAAKQRETSDN